MRTAVVDASAMVETLSVHPLNSRMAHLIGDDGTDIAVPHVCDIEVASALRAMVLRGYADVARCEAALSAYRAIPLERFDHSPLLGRIFAMRDNFSAYDAAYVALAEVLDAPLYTADTRLARSVEAHTGVNVVEV